MKRFLKCICSLIFLCAIALLVACDGCNGCSSSIVPEKIVSWNLPKNEYELGEYLDVSESSIEVLYTNGETKTVEVVYDMVTVYDLSSGSLGEKSLKVAYEEKGVVVTFYTTITINVPKNRLDSISDINTYKETAINSEYAASSQAQIEAIKVLARSAIYAALNDEEVSEIVINTKAAIDTVLTTAQEDAVAAAAAKALDDLKEELNEKITTLVGTNTSVADMISEALKDYTDKDGLDTIVANVTAAYTEKINDLQAQINDLDTGSVTAVANVKYENNKIYYQMIGDTSWTELADLTGIGTAGEKVELQASTTHIQWKYASATTWTDLIALTELKGADGTNGTNGNDGAPGAPGNDGADGVGVQSVTIDPLNGDLIITYTNGSQANAGNTWTDISALQSDITTLTTKLNNELDTSVEGSLQNQITALKAQVEALDIADTFDGIQDQIDAINAFFTNSGIDLSVEGTNLLNSLEVILADKVNELLGSAFTVDELKDKLTVVLGYVKNAYNAKDLIKGKLSEVKSILTNDTLDAKEKLSQLIGVARTYGDVLVALGVSSDTVELISSSVKGIINNLVASVKTKLLSIVNSYLVDYLYDLDSLIEEYATNATLQAYATDLQNYLSDLGYDGATQFTALKGEIVDLINELSLTNITTVGIELFGKVVQLQTIDSLNELVPALLAVYLEKAYNSYVAQLQDVFDADVITAAAYAKDKYLMAILKSKSVIEAIDYALLAEDAFIAATPLGQLETLIAAIPEINASGDKVAINAAIGACEDKVAAIRTMILTNAKNSQAALLQAAYATAYQEVYQTVYNTAREALRDSLEETYPIATDDQINQMVAAGVQDEDFISAVNDAYALAKGTAKTAIDNAFEDKVDDAIVTLYNAYKSMTGATTTLTAQVTAARAAYDALD